jgi:hypothetical protein
MCSIFLSQTINNEVKQHCRKVFVHYLASVVHLPDIHLISIIHVPYNNNYKDYTQCFKHSYLIWYN